jgi:hypothetical protein
VEKWQQDIDAGKAEQTIATGGFLSLLQYLRTVVLQDAVVLQDLTPSHPIWKHNLFSSSAFVAFKETAKQQLRTTEDPAEQRLQKAIPILNAKIDGIHNDLKSAMDQTRSTLEAVEGNLTDVLRALSPLQGGKAFLQVQLVSGDQTGVTEASNVSFSSSTNATAIHQREGDTHHTSVIYSMSRSLVGVGDLWKEWSIGLNGGPAVHYLEEKYGAKWCSSDERRFFNRLVGE